MHTFHSIRRLFLLLLLSLAAGLPVAAQKGLHIAPYLSMDYSKKHEATYTSVKGDQLREWHLTLFKSISLSHAPQEAARIARDAQADGAAADQSEEVKKGDRLMACYYQLPPPEGKKNAPNRFVLFRRTEAGAATLIYIEGYTDLDKLIKLFIHKK